MNYIKLFENNTAYQADKANFLHPHVSYILDERKVIYEKNAPTPPAHDYSQDYLTLEALSNGKIGFSSTANDADDLQYSTDSGATWDYYGGLIDGIPVSTGDKVMLKAAFTATTTNNGCANISSTCNFNAMGNPLSLCYNDFATVTTITKERLFRNMFSGCTGLVSAENLSLPATTVSNGCYFDMFAECTSLTTAPTELPATTLSGVCYKEMFYGCTSLTTAPSILPATTLEQSCYHSMFSGCTSLVNPPVISATTLGTECCLDMFAGCTALTSAPALPATTLGTRCCQGMFKDCTSLTTAPSILPATALTSECYVAMFRGCTSLTTAPELPAATLKNYCYADMFSGCTSLNSVKMLATDISATDCLDGWLEGVAATGTFTKSSSMSSLPSGASGIPANWTVVDV